MVEIAVISDTHIPSRAGRIPGWIAERVREADHTIHAGDFDSPGAYEDVVNLVGDDFTAVRGNMDPGSLGLPTTATVEFEGVTFVVTHGTGSLDDYEERVAGVVHDEADGDAIGVSGHTHEILDEVVDGVRLLNPGSATGASPAETESMMTVRVEDGDVDVEVHER